MLSPSELKQKERSPSPEAPSPVRNTRRCPSGPQVPHTAASLPLLQEQRAYDIRKEHRCVRNNETRSMSCPVVKLGRIISNLKKNMHISLLFLHFTYCSFLHSVDKVTENLIFYIEHELRPTISFY